MKTKRTLALLTMAALAGASLLTVAGQTAFETSALSKIALRHAGAERHLRTGAERLGPKDLKTGCPIGWYGEGSDGKGGLLPPTYFADDDEITVWRCNPRNPPKSQKKETNANSGVIDSRAIASTDCPPAINVMVAKGGKWHNANYKQRMKANPDCGRHGVLGGHLVDGKWFTYSPEKDEAKDAQTGAIVWMKKKDAKGRVIEYLSGSQTYLFNYRDKDVEVSVLDKDKRLLKKVAVSHGDIIKIFPRN